MALLQQPKELDWIGLDWTGFTELRAWARSSDLFLLLASRGEGLLVVVRKE